MLIFSNAGFCENPDSTLAKLAFEREMIFNASKHFEVNPIYLASIIFVERSENYDWKDKALDIILAKSGKNSSIGFAQVKLKTAYWIERQLDDSLTVFFPGRIYTGILQVSKSPSELLTKLQNGSLNILYAAAYLRIIQSRWRQPAFPLTTDRKLSAHYIPSVCSIPMARKERRMEILK